MSRGETFWVELPPANGREQVGRRPSVIVQDETYAATSPLVIVVPLTGAVAASRFPGAVLVDPTPQNGLERPSVALVFQVRAIDRRRVNGKIGALDTEALSRVFEALDRLTGRTSGA
jgi:mRNA interferase MazF